MPPDFLHRHSQFKDLLEITAEVQKIDDPSLIEKDYWIMHCLYGLKQSGLTFELKGGTSLSKGYAIIHRFSEDIDVHIEPDPKAIGFDVYTGKNHDKPRQRESRKDFFQWLCDELPKKIPDIAKAVRDNTFDDESGRFRNGGIRLFYPPTFKMAPGIKEGILLEVGFDKTAPNQPKLISSWAFDRALTASVSTLDNRAHGVPCYEPKYTFVEKLQAVVRKYRLMHETPGGPLPPNFLRHFYDLRQLIDLPDVQRFIGTSEYEAFKKERFKGDDTKVKNSGAFRLDNPAERKAFELEYDNTRALYYRERPTLDEIIKRIAIDLERL